MGEKDFLSRFSIFKLSTSLPLPNFLSVSVSVFTAPVTHQYIAGAEYKFKYGLGIIAAYRFRVYDGYKYLGLSGASGGESEVYGLNCYGHEITFGISYNFDSSKM